MKRQLERPELVLFESALFRTVTTLIVGERHLLLVDPNWLPQEIAHLADVVAPLADGRECYLLFTHSDYDHIIGYGKFSHFRTIASEAFAHATDRDKALRQVTDWDDSNYIQRDYSIVYPPIDRPIAGDGTELTLGADTYTFYQAPGHNSDGLITLDRSRGILIVGDYLSNIEFPYIYHSIADYRATLTTLEEVIRGGGVEVLVTGHGDHTTEREEMLHRIRESRQYIDELVRSVQEGTPFDLDRLLGGYAYPTIMRKFHAGNVALAQSLAPAFPALLHYEVAQRILTGYMSYYYRFKLITKRARIRFERRDWHGTQADARSRIALYRDEVAATTEQLHELMAAQTEDHAFWAKVRDAYAEDIAHFNTRNIAETFFNSVYRYTYGIGADPQVMFVVRTGSYREHRGISTITYDFALGAFALDSIVRQVLDHFPFEVPWDDRERDIRLVAERWRVFVRERGGRHPGDQLEVLQSVFYRNKTAYIVGRFLSRGAVFPFILPLLHPVGRGVLIDALLLEADQVVSIFSYHRSYFLADISVPSDMVDFLQTFMPSKRISELYNAIGFEKHGKTVFYRELLRHFNRHPAPEESFESAPGIAGMVMYVFTSPKLNMVFKVIRDHFAPPKQVTPETVKARYELVKRHDRVGRMADSYLFEKLALPRDRFGEACLAELLETAPSKVELLGDCVLLSHVYIEKKMTPLNLYLQTASEAMAQKALRDYGRAIKQLAAANIFPGDLLLKNFGVTRVNRVVFYDYDEIEHVTDCNFRHLPEPRTPEQEMASQPWYYVGPRDVFPEEFPGFLMRAGPHLSYLRQQHSEIFDADFWNDVKQRLLAGEIMDVFPYRTGWRFLQ